MKIVIDSISNIDNTAQRILILSPKFTSGIIPSIRSSMSVVISNMQICWTLYNTHPLSSWSHFSSHFYSKLHEHVHGLSTDLTTPPQSHHTENIGKQHLYLAKPTQRTPASTKIGDFSWFRNHIGSYKLQQQLTCLAVASGSVLASWIPKQQRCKPTVTRLCNACFQADKCHREYVRTSQKREIVLPCGNIAAYHPPRTSRGTTSRRGGRTAANWIYNNTRTTIRTYGWCWLMEW